MSDELVKCIVCAEWTHPMPDGTPRCPKHLPEVQARHQDSAASSQEKSKIEE